jgi:hypothetical protein
MLTYKNFPTISYKWKKYIFPLHFLHTHSCCWYRTVLKSVLLPIKQIIKLLWHVAFLHKGVRQVLAKHSLPVFFLSFNFPHLCPQNPGCSIPYFHITLTSLYSFTRKKSQHGCRCFHTALYHYCSLDLIFVYFLQCLYRTSIKHWCHTSCLLL